MWGHLELAETSGSAKDRLTHILMGSEPPFVKGAVTKAADGVWFNFLTEASVAADLVDKIKKSNSRGFRLTLTLYPLDYPAEKSNEVNLDACKYFYRDMDKDTALKFAQALKAEGCHLQGAKGSSKSHDELIWVGEPAKASD